MLGLFVMRPDAPRNDDDGTMCEVMGRDIMIGNKILFLELSLLLCRVATRQFSIFVRALKFFEYVMLCDKDLSSTPISEIRRQWLLQYCSSGNSFRGVGSSSCGISPAGEILMPRSSVSRENKPRGRGEGEEEARETHRS